MSTQTEKTPAQLAEEFLKKYATVIGTLDAIKEKDRNFLLKYATVVGTPEAVETYAPAEPEEVIEPIDVTGDPVDDGDENE